MFAQEVTIWTETPAKNQSHVPIDQPGVPRLWNAFAIQKASTFLTPSASHVLPTVYTHHHLNLASAKPISSTSTINVKPAMPRPDTTAVTVFVTGDTTAIEINVKLAIHHAVRAVDHLLTNVWCVLISHWFYKMVSALNCPHVTQVSS